MTTELVSKTLQTILCDKTRKGKFKLGHYQYYGMRADRIIRVNVKFQVQYGQRIRGLAAYLHDYQLIPYDRCCQLLMDVCGFENEAKKLLSQSPVIHFDQFFRMNGICYGTIWGSE
ncbi:MAG: hypothetical protein FIB07_02350 [Candidatus Methanoperedens sp.]|nr:hypothetical protein [Candidatus Methanoperedens sp.]